MPRLKPSTQAARREHILDAAEICFARHGFHNCTMQDICKAAGVSPGALYVYFSSKEDLIAGIAERDRAKLQEQFAEVAKAPDLLSALQRLGDHYMHEEPRHKLAMCIEIGAESTRNRLVGDIHLAVDKFIFDSFTQVFERARLEGKIAPQLDSATLARIVQLVGDGMFWRRAVDPEFDAAKIMPAVMAVITSLLAPVGDGTLQTQSTSAGSQP